jgi:hypothetical protein
VFFCENRLDVCGATCERYPVESVVSRAVTDLSNMGRRDAETGGKSFQRCLEFVIV